MQSVTDAKYCVVLSTAPSLEEGRRIARELVERRLVACVNLVPGVESVYRWDDKVESAAEVLLVMKTLAQKADAVAAAVREIHGYEVPELIVLPIIGGLETYLNWIETSV